MDVEFARFELFDILMSAYPEINRKLDKVCKKAGSGGSAV
ncbi:hypothetical protein NMH_2105 [Neisseria meningitidis H44/76]|jgi:hypothetical protein|uniref:Uncharacterized protein n=4 Tax=Neisseria meningitidis TaxID=487 RepID=A0A0H5QE79_NEIMI|nr:hypothetical protein NMH_2105 [Neisseria meningitidis H44/76]KER38719.1 hypothetical protein F528_2378 [Neisseria meningitidis 992008]CRZ00292.1 FIG00848146: hypothetical protein [Neisseria meningitidis serogroup B]